MKNPRKDDVFKVCKSSNYFSKMTLKNYFLPTFSGPDKTLGRMRFRDFRRIPVHLKVWTRSSGVTLMFRMNVMYIINSIQIKRDDAYVSDKNDVVTSLALESRGMTLMFQIKTM